MKADQNYDEWNFRERASRNPSVSGLLDNKAQGEPPLQLNKQIGSAEESQNSISDDKMKKDTENNNSQGDNVISNDKVKVNDAAKLKSSTTGSGKLVPKKGAGILDLGMLKCKCIYLIDLVSKEEVVKEEIIIPWGIIRYSNKWRMRWEILIMIAATYNGFSVPYLISFIPKYQFTNGWDQINIFY